jgi:hypothetical protein
VADEQRHDDSSALWLLLLLGLGVAAAIFFSSEKASADTTSGDGSLFPAPPADSVWNPEVGDAVSGATSFPVTDAKIVLLATAIATAEGFYNKNPNVIPRRGHNPGDLTVAFGQANDGVLNSEGVLAFSDDNAGWTALKTEARMMLDGTSRIYSPSMSVRQVATKYTGGDASGSWADNAAKVLGISADQTLGDFLAL